jgi:3-oxoadipate enol-lactonase
MHGQDAIELRFSEHGSGPAVVLLHGFPLDRSMWDDQVPALAERYRTIVPDLRGHGVTDAPPGPFTMEQHVADVVALLDRLGLERVALVGLSMGGYITMNFLARRPERVWAVVLADTRPQEDASETKQARAAQARLVQTEGLEPFIEQQLPRMFAAATLRDRPDLADRYREIVRRARPNAVAAALEGLAARPDTTATLRTVACPALVIVGSEDLATPAADSHLMAELIPDARLEVIEGVGHMSNMEAPERFNAALLSFLEGTAPHP